jgi:hypothetical protein
MARSLFIFEVDGPTLTPRQHAIREAEEQRKAEQRYWDWAAEQDGRAEIEAEMACERYFEDRGYEEARAQEHWEMMRGITEYL